MKQPTDAPTVDFRELFKRIGYVQLEHVAASDPPERPQADIAVELLEVDPRPVSGNPMQPVGVVDGIQASLCITYIQHRPVYLSYAAAGCVDADASLIHHREMLYLTCSASDEDWAREVAAGIPVQAMESRHPAEVERAASRILADCRERLEVDVLTEVHDRGQGPLLVDGSLVGKPARVDAHGVVKDTNRVYLPDETVLLSLPGGWRSPVFKLPAGSQGVPVDRYSCYVRIQDARHARWQHGLIRLESFQPDLDPLAARALAERQGPGSGDKRWDRHLASVRACEEVLRARRPAVYSL